MNWEAIGAIGEVLGSVIIFATLIYLAVQVRINDKTTKIDMRQRMMENQNQVNRDIYLNEDLAELISSLRDLDDTTTLDPGPRQRMFRFVYTDINRYEQNYFLYKEGVIDEEANELNEGAIRASFKVFPIYRQIWKSWRENCSKDFATYIDNIVGVQDDT